jgi:hypothetical protein
MKKHLALNAVLAVGLIIGLMALVGTAAASGPVHWG